MVIAKVNFYVISGNEKMYIYILYNIKVFVTNTDAVIYKCQNKVKQKITNKAFSFKGHVQPIVY